LVQAENRRPHGGSGGVKKWMKTPLGWSKLTLFLESNYELPSGGSAVDLIKELALLQAVMQRKQMEVSEAYAMCQAMICSGEDDRKPFWDAWQTYLSEAYPFMDNIKQMDRDKVKKYMEEQMDHEPLIVRPLPRKKGGSEKALSKLREWEARGRKRS
jgi:hypothetical protein